MTQSEKQTKYYAKYEDKLAAANEETERQRLRVDDLQYRI